MALLPTQLAIVAEQTSGKVGPTANDAPSPVSLVLDLRRNSREQLDVRVSNGMRLWDGQHLWALGDIEDVQGHGLHVRDQQAQLGGDIPLRADRPLYVVGMTRRDVFVQLPDRSVFRCALARPTCEASAMEALPLNHPGPGAGFELTLTGGVLRLTMPFTGGEPAVLLDRVTRIIGVHWVHEAWLPQDPMLDQAYRGRARIVAQRREVTVEGALGDWADAEPLVVDAPWQVDSGAEHWSGAGDASFSVAAARQSRGADSGQVCFAGRVRDDAWTDEDVVLLRFGSAELRTVPSEGGSGWSSFGDGFFSRTFEVCTAADSGDLPFVAAYIDHDPDGTSTLSSAALNGGKSEGRLSVP